MPAGSLHHLTSVGYPPPKKQQELQTTQKEELENLKYHCEYEFVHLSIGNVFIIFAGYLLIPSSDSSLLMDRVVMARNSNEQFCLTVIQEHFVRTP